MRDYVELTRKYAKEALTVEGKHGHAFKQMAANFLRDVDATNPNWRFDAEAASRPCRFIEMLPHVEGKWDTPNITLHASHIFFLVNLFGFIKPDGNRRYTTALFCVARKNAKSTLAAGILLYCLCCEDEQGAQIITAATTGDQARIIFKTAKMMVERTPDLKETFGLSAWANAISRFEIGGNLKPINAKASTQDGLNPSHVALDEIHAHPNHDLLNVLKSAAGARKNPLFLYTTTEGYANAGPWQEIRDFADNVLDGTVEAEHFLPVIFRIDEGDEPLNPKVWQKANPLIDVNPVLMAEISKEAIEAANMSGRLSEFLIKRVNRPASGAHGYLDLSAWDQCKGEIDLDWLKSYPCYGGLDLSSTSDISSFRLLWRIEDTYYTWGMRWCPSQIALSNTGHGKEAYLDWVKQGRIKETPGNVIDHRVIREDILKLAKKFNIKQIAVDDSNARGLVIDLTEAGIPMMPLYQGAKTYHGPLQELEIAYKKKNIVHDGDPVLRWMLSNVVVKCDTEGRNKPDKTSRRLKIDDASALLMAFERWITEPVVDSGSFIDAWYAEELAKEKF